MGGELYLTERQGTHREGQGTQGGEKIEAGNSDGDFLKTGKWNQFNFQIILLVQHKKNSIRKYTELQRKMFE